MSIYLPTASPKEIKILYNRIALSFLGLESYDYINDFDNNEPKNKCCFTSISKMKEGNEVLMSCGQTCVPHNMFCEFHLHFDSSPLGYNIIGTRSVKIDITTENQVISKKSYSIGDIIDVCLLNNNVEKDKYSFKAIEANDPTLEYSNNLRRETKTIYNQLHTIKTTEKFLSYNCEFKSIPVIMTIETIETETNPEKVLKVKFIFRALIATRGITIGEEIIPHKLDPNEIKEESQYIHKFVKRSDLKFMSPIETLDLKFMFPIETLEDKNVIKFNFSFLESLSE
jgi:hypothetical protein